MAAANATASSTARFLDKLVATAPFRIEAVQVRRLGVHGRVRDRMPGKGHHARGVAAEIPEDEGLCVILRSFRSIRMQFGVSAVIAGP